MNRHSVQDLTSNSTPVSKNKTLAGSTANSDVDPQALSQNVNAVILQYLESCGLEDSYSTFCKECQDKGVPFPKDLPSPSFPKSNFNQIDSKKLLEYFDDEDEANLQDAWIKFYSELDESEKYKVGTITFYLQIFISIIPFRKNQTESARINSMGKLRQWFQEKSNEFNPDANMLSLFALPFVPNPMNHPIFKDVFLDPWKAKLRCQIHGAISHHFNNSAKHIPGAESELTQMFISYIQGDSDNDDDNDNNLISASSQTNIKKQTLVSNNKLLSKVVKPITKDQASQSDLITHQDDRNTVIALDYVRSQNRKLSRDIQELKTNLYDSEDRYLKLIQSFTEVISSLELAVQGKFQNIQELRDRLQDVYPELFSSENETGEVPRKKTILFPVEESEDEEESLIDQQNLPSQSDSDTTDDQNNYLQSNIQKTVESPRKPSGIPSPRHMMMMTKAPNQNGNSEVPSTYRVKSQHAVLKPNPPHSNLNSVMNSQIDQKKSVHQQIITESTSKPRSLQHHPQQAVCQMNESTQHRPNNQSSIPKQSNPLQPTAGAPKDYVQANIQATQSRPSHTQRQRGISCLSHNTYVPEKPPPVTLPSQPQNLSTKDSTKIPSLREASNNSGALNTNVAQQSYINAKQLSSLQYHGRPLASMCPNSLRTNFQPIKKVYPNLNETLRTQTRVIHKPELPLVQTECLNDKPKDSSKIKKAFKRSQSQSMKQGGEKSDEESTQVEQKRTSSKPRRKWADSEVPPLPVESEVEIAPAPTCSRKSLTKLTINSSIGAGPVKILMPENKLQQKPILTKTQGIGKIVVGPSASKQRK